MLSLGINTIGASLTSNNRITIPKNHYYFIIGCFSFRGLSAKDSVNNIEVGYTRWRNSTEGTTTWWSGFVLSGNDLGSYKQHTIARMVSTADSVSSNTCTIAPYAKRLSDKPTTAEFYSATTSIIQLNS